MQVTTLTVETVTLVMPFQFGFDKVLGSMDEDRMVASIYFPHFRVYLKAIGRDQWWRVQEFLPGKPPALSYQVRDVDELALLNAQIQEAA